MLKRKVRQQNEKKGQEKWNIGKGGMRRIEGVI